MLKQRARLWLAISVMASLLALGACGGKSGDETAGDNTGGKTGGTEYAPTGNEGSITGKISLNGHAVVRPTRTGRARARAPGRRGS